MQLTIYLKSSKLIIISSTILLTCIVICYFPVLKSLILLWSYNEDYSHGFFIPLITGYLIWTKRKHLSFNPSNIGFLIILLSLSIYIAAYYIETYTIIHLSLVLSFFGISLFIFGKETTKKIAFPLFFLIFMFPIPSSIYAKLTLPLQLLVTKLSISLTQLVGIPSYREGNIIYLPSHSLEVVNVCSGLRSLIALLALGSIFAYLSFKSNIKRFLLIISVIPISIILNTLRVSISAILSYYWNISITGTLHILLGLFIFILALIFLLCIKKLLICLSL